MTNECYYNKSVMFTEMTKLKKNFFFCFIGKEMEFQVD